MHRYRGGSYGRPVQTLNSLALDLGLHSPSEIAKLVNTTARDVDGRGGHLSTGIIGTKHLLSALSRYGRADVALEVATTTEYPGWGYMVAQGATSVRVMMHKCGIIGNCLF